MNASFNLVDEPWIPCVTPDGQVVHRGILAALTIASQDVEIRDESPLVTVALHRLLLAILHRVFGPRTPTEWGKLWNNGTGNFDEAKLRAYLTAPKVHCRFDLFHTTHPFYQRADLPLGTPEPKNMGRGKYVKPIWQMAHELAYSDSMNLFAHFKENDWETRPAAEAARWLIAFQGFALGGRITFGPNENTKTEGSADAGHLVKSAVVLVKGGNLFQTLMLNLVHYSEDDEEPFAFSSNKDKPAWERDEPVKPADRRFDGYLDLLTWQSRRVKLVPELTADGKLVGVSGVVAMKGWQLPGFDRYTRETMCGFVKAEKAPEKQDPWPPLGFRAGKELWRDSHALFQSVAEKSERPKVLKWIDDLRGEHDLIPNKPLTIDVVGMNSNQAKIAYWRHESFVLPLDYLDEKKPELLDTLKRGLRLAEEVADVLRHAVRAAVKLLLMGESGGEPDKDRLSDLCKSFAPEAHYWSRLEAPYRKLLMNLADSQTPEAKATIIIAWFNDKLTRFAWEAFNRTVGKLIRGRRSYAARFEGDFKKPGGETAMHRGFARLCKTEGFPKLTHHTNEEDQ
jgi:CRISPR system Cascade subunit CasA